MEAALLEARFAELLGPEQIVSDRESLSAYDSDLTENPPGHAELAVKPTTVEQVQEIVRLAAAEQIPIVPCVARTNVGGLAIPSRGGVVVDLSQMNRVHELDRENMYALIEPGVTFGQLKELLDREAPELIVSFPLSPVYASVLVNALLDGLGNLSLRHGTSSEQIGGVEVVLPDGTLARTGTAAISNHWLSRAPLPDLTGLFVNWQGTTGIVTKLAMQLWPRPKLTRRLFIATGDMARSFALVRELARTELCRDPGGISWPAGKMLLGVPRPLHRDPSEPEFFVYLDIGASDKDELAYKERAIKRALEHHRKAGLPVSASLSIDELIAVAPSFGRFAEFPMTLDFLLDYPGGGLTWVGTYGPTAKWPEGAVRCARLMTERGFPPLIVSRPMKGGHFGVLRLICSFDQGDADEVQRVGELNRELLDICVELGFVPYKAPDWMLRELGDRTDPGFKELLGRIRRTLDPAGIMNPGRLPL
jgi:FAD/FMN-containing dehydrogenase